MKKIKIFWSFLRETSLFFTIFVVSLGSLLVLLSILILDFWVYPESANSFIQGFIILISISFTLSIPKIFISLSLGRRESIKEHQELLDIEDRNIEKMCSK